MKGREGSVGGRVTSKAMGNGGGCSNRICRLRLLPQDPSQQGTGQVETPTTPGRGPSMHGGGACGQSNWTPTAGSIDRVGEHGVT